jgi:hypothetical protein
VRHRRKSVPPAVVFQTEPALALEMVKGVTERGHLPFQLTGCEF